MTSLANPLQGVHLEEVFFGPSPVSIVHRESFSLTGGKTISNMDLIDGRVTKVAMRMEMSETGCKMMKGTASLWEY